MIGVILYIQSRATEYIIKKEEITMKKEALEKLFELSSSEYCYTIDVHEKVITEFLYERLDCDFNYAEVSVDDYGNVTMYTIEDNDIIFKYNSEEDSITISDRCFRSAKHFNNVFYLNLCDVNMLYNFLKVLAIALNNYNRVY